MKRLMNGLQPLGRALMLPIAVLPIAGLLLRVGQPDLLDIAFVSAAGNAIFANLGALFAIGVATGFSRDGNGAACLAGVVCFLVARHGAQALMTVPALALAGFAGPSAKLAGDAWRAQAIAKVDIPIGVVSGLSAGLLYNRFAAIRLPEYLAFFGGRRFVPIASGAVGLLLAAAIGGWYGAIESGIDGLSRTLAASGEPGLFLYGAANRLLLVTGLHHLLNNVVWFLVGDYHGTTGDLRRFFAGDPQAGAFMTGFFPVMMFGLPAACLAMYHAALAARRKAVAGMLLSLALTSFVTGVTEPIEFSFMFLAPALYAVHALLTGAAMAITDALGIRIGFGFSAGLLDYVLNFGKATRPLALLAVGAAYAIVYYAVFRVMILRFDLPTPGREPLDDTAREAARDDAGPGVRGAAFVAALGGGANLVSIGACTTRLRLIVGNAAIVDDARLKRLGARGVLRPSPTAVQVVLGPEADQVAIEIRDAAGAAAAGPSPAAASPADTERTALAAPLADALGGDGNLLDWRWYRGRIAILLADATGIDEAALAAAGIRAMAVRDDGTLHLLFAEADRARLERR